MALKNPALLNHINTTRGKLTALVTYLEYFIANLCVKSDPMLLLEIKIPISGSDAVNIEEACLVRQPDDKHFILEPFNDQFIPQICKGVILRHPLLEISQNEKENEDDPVSLLVTVPEMNKNRRDTLKTAIDAKYEEMKVHMQEAEAKASAELTHVASKIKAQELEDTKEALKNLHEDMFGLLDEIKDGYVEYIEKTYQEHELAKEGKNGAPEEATNPDAGQKMKL